MDVLAFGAKDDKGIKNEQKSLAQIVTSENVQKRFNYLKGSMTVETDINLGPGYADECSLLAYDLIRNNKIIPTGSFVKSDITEFAVRSLGWYVKHNPDTTAEQAVAFVLKRFEKKSS
ncbi:MAG: hypothetical protein OCC45_01665 [Desulfotalea sp.]